MIVDQQSSRLLRDAGRATCFPPDRPRDRIILGIEFRMLPEMPDEAADDGCDAEGIFETRASVGDPQFDRRIPQRGSDRPPHKACVRNYPGRRQRIDIALVFF